MKELIQQLAVLDVLLSNWDGVVIRMGRPDSLRDEALAALAVRLSDADGGEDVDVVLDDLLDLVEDTPAYDYVRELISRVQLGAESVAKTRGWYAGELGIDDESGMLGDTAGLAGKSLGRALGVEVEPVLVKVYFATNRKSSDHGQERFSGEPDTAGFSLGMAEVTIPVALHRKGVVEQKKWWEPLRDKDDPRRYVVLGRVDSLSQELFSSYLSSGPDFSGELLVFLHGYNVTFEDAVRHAAQFAYDLRFNGPVVLYSWPSLGSLAGYCADEERAFLSSGPLADFLQLLADGPWKKVHILAHSMGNRVMLYGLSGNAWPKSSTLGQVVFVAADVYVETFRQLFPKIREKGSLYTSYASKSDRALLLSSILHKADRIGIAKGDPFVIDGMETIDATKVDTGFLGHGYFAEKASVITDLADLIGKGLPASRRNLYQPPSKLYWDFKR
ncbi:MAG: alpha/beta hydrolase [Chlorobiaceae bacterium]|nr:alpha/beta hydrolase [Chlorobiaceae bacterium]